MPTKHIPAYFKVFALKDGTVLLAMPTRKPAPNQLSGERISEEGVWRWYIEGDHDLDNYKVEVRHLAFATIANRINLRQTLRQQVEPRFDALAKLIAEIKDQLDRIEAKLCGN